MTLSTIEWPQASEKVETGEHVRDRKRPNKTGTVLAVRDIPANEYYVDAIEKTVAADNPNHPENDPVVELVWDEYDTNTNLDTVREQRKVYHFPISRLVAESCIRDVEPNKLHESPYHHRSFSWDEDRNRPYIYSIRSQGHHNSILLARQTDAGLELVAGHKRRWVAEEAGLDTVAVRIVDLGDWEAAIHYAEDHLYDLDNEAAQQAVESLVDQWGENVLSLQSVNSAIEWHDLNTEHLTNLNTSGENQNRPTTPVLQNP